MAHDPQPGTADDHPAGQRLQKVLAAAGLGSRRECEELILEGRVEVDRQVVTELGTRADPRSQEIRVDGETLRPPKFIYYALHKPPDVVCTARDPSGRPRAIDLVPPDPRVFAVGRLDMSSEGLLLLTNDGDLANGLTHPRHEVEKVYRVLVAGQLGEEELFKLRRGMHFAEGFARPRRIRIVSTHPKHTWLEMVLDEGRNREIRRLLARVGHKVQRLMRIAIGSLRLGELPRGAYRLLRHDEVDGLRRDVAESRRRHRQKPPEAGAGSLPPKQGRKPRRAKVTAAAGETRKALGGRPSRRFGRPASSPGRKGGAPGKRSSGKRRPGTRGRPR
jgi:23S rRNA pseudouridine2605 synthase